MQHRREADNVFEAMRSMQHARTPKFKLTKEPKSKENTPRYPTILTVTVHSKCKPRSHQSNTQSHFIFLDTHSPFLCQHITHRAYLKCGFSFCSNKSARMFLRTKHQHLHQSNLTTPAQYSPCPHHRLVGRMQDHAAATIVSTHPPTPVPHNSPSDSPSCKPPNTPPARPPAPQSTQSSPRNPTDNAAPRG